MCTLYLDQQGGRLSKNAGRFVVCDRDGGEQSLPLEQVDRVMIYGRVQVTTDALDALLERGVPTTLLSSRGWLRGHLLGDCGGQVQRRARQYALISDAEQALPLARALVIAKLRNQRWLLRTLDQRERAMGLNPYLVSAEQVDRAESLRGIEGSAARAYFAAFPDLLAESAFTFPGRRKRPATDPVNALLSLGYTLLLAEVRNALHGYGLDPFAGVFHASDGGQPSCALDLMEPLRPLVDRLVIRLARQVMQPEDFVVQENGAYLLKDGRRGPFYRAWEEFLAERVLWQGVHHPYRAILHEQAGEWARCLDDPERPFRPLALSAIGR